VAPNRLAEVSREVTIRSQDPEADIFVCPTTRGVESRDRTRSVSSPPSLPDLKGADLQKANLESAAQVNERAINSWPGSLKDFLAALDPAANTVGSVPPSARGRAARNAESPAGLGGLAHDGAFGNAERRIGCDGESAILTPCLKPKCESG
jgi:hypothetical protein